MFGPLTSIYKICYTTGMPRWRSPRMRALTRERARLLRELSTLSGLLRGSLFERFSTCTRPRCQCHAGRPHGPRTYVAVTSGKRQRQHYVPQSQRVAVREGVRQFHRLLAIADRLTAINLELMRGGVLDEPEP